MKILIPELADTAKLGAALAKMVNNVPGNLLLLQGDLGAGKTTLVRHLVENLPGGDNAEVSSPSFTLCNSYPCDPPVLHFDLYRLEPWQDDEDLLEALQMAESSDLLLLVEWPERMKEGLLPPNFLHCALLGAGQNRCACFQTMRSSEFLFELAATAELAGLTIINTNI